MACQFTPVVNRACTCWGLNQVGARDTVGWVRVAWLSKVQTRDTVWLSRANHHGGGSIGS